MPDELPILHTEQRGDGPPLLFLHGLADTSACWEAVIDELASDHRCVTADLPGHGRSPAPDDPTAYERDGVLGSIDAVLDRTGPAVAVGHSLGGYLALAHSITRPGVLRGLALVSTGPGFRDDASRERWNDRVLKGASGYSISETAATIGLHVDSLVIDRL
ncbi:MAG: alpha/beta fold hydrolase, partial [Acidimicrobiales bacterium]